MAEQIGLSAVFSLDQWSGNQKKYVNDLGKAEGATSKAAGGMGKAWGQLGSSVTKTTAILGGAVVGAAALAGAAIAKFTGDGISKAIQLDQKMADIAAIMGKTRAEIEPLNKLIIDLGIDPNLKVSAEEAAAAIEMLAANGLNMTQIMDGAAKATVLLANATGAEFDVAANIATDAMAIFNIEAGDMIEAVNGITSVTVASKFGINDYALALSQGGGVAASAGVSFEDFNSSIAAISPLFASGSDAGTSFKTMINSLTPNSKEAAKVMKELGLEFFNADGSMRSMAEISSELNTAFAGLTEEQKALAVETMFGADASRAAIALAESGRVVYTDLATAMTATGLSQEVLSAGFADGALTAFELTQAQMSLTDANAQAATRMDTVAGAMEILSGVVETLQIQIGQAFLPIIRAMVEAFTAFVTQHSPAIIAAFQAFAENVVALGQYLFWATTEGETMNDWLTEMHPLLATVVIGTLGLVEGLTTLIGWVSSTVGKFIEWQDVLIVVGAAIASVVIPAILGMVAAMAPAIAVFALAVGAVAAVRLAWENDFLGIQTTVTNAINAIIEVFAPLTSAIAEFGTGALTEIKNFATGNATEFENLKAIWDGAKTSANTMFTDLTSYVQTNLPTWTTNLQQWGVAASQWIVDAHLIVAAKMTEWGMAVLGYVTDNLPAWQTQLLSWGTAAGQWIIDAVPIVQAQMVTWGESVLGYVTANLPAWQTTLTGWATAAWQWIVDATGQVATKLGEWYTSLSGYVNSQLPSWTQTLVNWSKAAWQWIVDAAGQVGAKLGEWWAAIKTWVDGKLPEWTQILVNWAKAAWQWIVDAANELPAKITEWYTKLKAEVDTRLTTWKTAFDDWIDATWQWLVDAAALMPEKVGKWYADLKSAVDSKLTEWQPVFDDWKTAASEWLAESSSELTRNVSAWFSDLVGSLNTLLPELQVNMLTWATALVEWIGDNAADALPALGGWLGKILAWIPLGLAKLVIEMVKMAGALIGWIAGGEGTSESESAAGKTDEAMSAFQAALIKALGQIKQGFVEAVQTFVTEWQTTMSEYVDWEQLGTDIMEAVSKGVESMKSAIIGKITDIVDGMKREFTKTISAFTQIGKDIINGVISGISGMKQAILDKIAEIAGALPVWMQELLGIGSPSKVFAEIGVNMMQGLIVGMESMKSGLRNSVGRLVGGLVSTLAGNMLAGPRNMLAEFGKLSADFMSAAGEWADAVQSLTGDGTDDNPASAALEMLGAQQGITDNLQRQLKLIDLLRAAGRDPAQFLGAGGALGRNADPVYMMNLLTEAAAAFNDQLEIQLRIAAKGYDTLINDLRKERQEIAEIEDLALRPTLRGVDFIRQQISDLDSQIAKAEQNLLNTGQAVYAEQLRQLHAMRQMRAAELSDYIKLWHQVEQTVEQAASFADKLTNERGAEAARRFVDNHIRPLMDMIQTPDATMDQRKVWASMINERMTLLVGYERSLRNVTKLEERLNAITSDSRFGTTISRNVKPLLDLLYDPMLSGPERNRIFNVLSGYQTRIAGLLSTINRLGTHSVFGDLSELMTPYLNKLLDVNLAEADRNKITAEFNRINQRLQTAQALDQATVSLQDRLDLLNKIKSLSAEMGSDSVLKYIIGDVDLMKGLSPEQFAGIYQRYSEQAVAAASKALREALLPDLTKEFNKAVGELRSFDQIMKEFDQTPLSDIDRAQQYLAFYDAELARLKELAAKGNQSAVDQAKHTKAARDQTIAWIRTYMDALVKADKHIARIQITTDERAADIAEAFRERLIDPLRELMEKNIGSDYRASLVTQLGQRVDQLNSYVRQINSLANLEKDINDAIGFNPLVARFAEQRLDPLLAAIYDINTAEAERLRLVQLYRQEQEKIVALNQKVQQLEFLEMQLSLLEQITQLNEEFGEQVPLSDILSGIQFGVNANMDQMLTFVSESLDAILRVTKHKLGISSPSKVFARIGAQMMEGMTMGIQSSIMQPIGMLRSAISDIPYAMQGRSLAVNMGGVTINNGMDDVMFEARVRQIIDKAF